MEGSFIKIVFGPTSPMLNLKYFPLATYPSSLLEDYSCMSGGQSTKSLQIISRKLFQMISCFIL